MFNKRAPLFTCAALAVLCCLVAWMRRVHARAATTAARTTTQSTVPMGRWAAGVEQSSDARSSDGVPSTQATMVSVSQYLSAYFGTRWDEVREFTRLSQKDLDALIDPALIPPWHDVEPQMLADLEASCADVEGQAREALKWDESGRLTDTIDFAASALNSDHKTMTASDIDGLRAAIAPFDAAIRELALHRAILMLPALMDAYRRGECERSPIVRVMPKRLRGGHVCALKILVADNWNMIIGFVEGDSPDYDAASAQIQDARRARFDKALELIARIK
jgi:hypothetical protein